MPKLTIDEREIEVPEGTKVIEAAERLGIMIPRFCYHPALGSVGACRVCAVKCLQGPFKGVQMSCMLDAQDGMVVSTTDPEAVDFRRHVIEWLMLHHPHDCPVCDEGGHCLLQDMTISGGHGRRRYEGRKRTYPDQDLGPLVQHEMNRCIHCYRCSRFYQEFAGYRDLGAMQIANRTYFGRFASGPLESPFAGNLSDLCPTGVYTDKPSRYKGRRWDYERTPAVCINCALGCHTVVNARYREVVRQEARFSPAVNGHFICDRGRFGFYYAELPDRPMTARVDGKEYPPAEGLQEAAARLDAVASRRGPNAVACLGGLRSSLETQAALHRLCRERGWQGPAFFTSESVKRRTMAAAALPADLALSLGEIESADAVVVMGADPLNEAPMLALALRQAHRRGAAVTVIDPRPIRLPLDFTHIAASPETLVNALGWLCRETIAGAAAASLSAAAKSFHQALDDATVPFEAALEPVAADLRGRQRPAIVCGTSLAADDLPRMAVEGVRLLRAGGQSAGLFYVLPRAGAFGAALLSGPAWEAVVAGIENGTVRALLVVETDPGDEFPDGLRLAAALKKLDLLVVCDDLDTAIGRRATVHLPAATAYESGGHFVNQEGRLQYVPAVSNGLSILQTGGGGHPPRTYDAPVPGNGRPPTWQALAILGGPGASDSAPLDYLAATRPGLPLAEALASSGDEGRRLLHTTTETYRFDPTQADRKTPPDGLQLVLSDWTFGSEALSVRSPCLAPLTPAPCAFLHPEDAAALGLSEDTPATITTERGRLTVAVRVTDRMAGGLLVLPRHYQLDWHIFPSEHTVITRDQIAPGKAGSGGETP